MKLLKVILLAPLWLVFTLIVLFISVMDGISRLDGRD